MLKNYLKVGLRSLRKNSVYSFINIAGLAIGISCAVLIFLWVHHETSYDAFLPKQDRIYQVYVNAVFDGKVNTWSSVPLPTYKAMKEADANILNSCVTGWGSTHLLAVDSDTRMNKPGYFVSNEFLDIFQFEIIKGDVESALKDPYSIALTSSTAKALFGDEEPMGKTIRLDNQYDLTVTAILADVPENSTFQFDYLLTWEFRALTNEWVKNNENNWGNYSFQVFIELNDGSRMAQTEAGIRDMLTKNGQDDIERELFLHGLPRWRLESNFEQGKPAGGMKDFVQLFTVIALFILSVACINFMNLSTARSEQRMKEVGVRKSIGSKRRELILQFLTESLLITCIAYCIAIGMVYLLLPSFNQLVDKQLELPLTNPTFWILSGSGILFTGILAGSYPAFYLSSFKPVQVLKGSVKSGKGGSLPRKILVVFQFGIAILLIISTVVIYQQIKFAQDRAIGYDRENLISVMRNSELDKVYESLKTELEQSSAVKSVTQSNGNITSINSNNFLGWPGKPEDLRVLFITITTKYDYAKTMGIKVLEGRDFSKDFKSDTAAIVINKTALDMMGLEDPIGTQVDLWGSKRTIIGVVDDVLMGSLYEPIRPLFMILDDWGGYISVRLSDSGPLDERLAQVKGIFEKYDPAHPFEYEFIDENFARKYSMINLTKNLALIFAALALVITGLGLFGLASFTAERRKKEIGIRKVLGASVPSIVSLMSKDFSILVVVAFCITSPIAWYALNSYLERYTLRIDIAWWIFPATGLLALVVAVCIVANQAFLAARANPVKSLRSE